MQRPELPWLVCDGVVITNPFLDETGRFPVNPLTYYMLSYVEVVFLYQLIHGENP